MSTASTGIEIVLEPKKGWAALQLHEVWEYRDLLYFMVWRDLKARYRQTALGPFWIILQPLVSMVLYTIVFGYIAKLPSDGVPYTVFLYVALLPWNFFSDAINSSVGSLLSSKDLIAKVYFPRLLIPLSKIISSLFDLGISFVILTLMLLFYNIRPTWGVILIPLFLFLAAVTGMGFGLLFSGLVVKYRDVGNLVSYAIRVWMFATPVVYSSTLIPEQWQTLYALNPMTGVVNGFRWALLGAAPPEWIPLALSAVFASGMLFVSLAIFARAQRSIVDIL